MGIDYLLRWTFARYAVDGTRLGIAGFSDGASYALSIGLANGDLFTHVLVFSAGIASPPTHVGRPTIYLSHGIHDPVLPIDTCGRAIFRELRRQGLDVRYREFDGGHSLPDDIRQEAVSWMVGSTSRAVVSEPAD